MRELAASSSKRTKKSDAAEESGGKARASASDDLRFAVTKAIATTNMGTQGAGDEQEIGREKCAAEG